MRLARAIAMLFCAAVPGFAQDFAGLKVGAPATAVAGLPGPVTLGETGPDRHAKFYRPDGSELSVTTRNHGPLIYLESSRNPAAVPLAAPGLRFGVTTRGDLRAMLGNDGFTYASRSRRQLASGQTVIFHSYALHDQPDVIATFAFLLTPDRAGLGEDAAILDSIVVAQQWYLDDIWGPAKTASANNAPITFNY